MPSAWVQTLKKEQLIEYLTALSINTEGTMDDLRKRLREYVKTNPKAFAPTDSDAPEKPVATLNVPQASTSASQNNTTASEDDVASYFSVNPRSRAPTPNRADTGGSIDRIRKWGCHFDGRDPFAFLERIEELREGYEVSDEQLLRGLPELLRGDSLLWYRNSRDAWSTWADFDRAFRRRYLPQNYHRQLRKEAHERKQRPGEPFVKYLDTIRTLMRRAGNFSEIEQLDIIADNMDPEIQMYLRPEDTKTIDELTERVSILENIHARKKLTRETNVTERRNSTLPRSNTAAVASAYNKYECCWRCKQRGHSRQDCRRPALKFCSQCGKDGVLTRECHPYPGNANRAGETTASPRSPV